MNDVMAVIERCLDEAGAAVMRHYGALDSIEMKGRSNLVTIADRESEACIKRIVSDVFPSHQILAEESGEDYEGKGEECRWVVDPLDGTTNFSHTMPIFCVSIGVEHKGKIVAAGVDNPYYHERFLAERGAGATFNGRRMRVSEPEKLADSLLVTGFPYDRIERFPHYMSFWLEMLPRVHGILRMGSAALDLCAVACGRLEAFWQENLHPWDTAAGWLLIEEAGGKVTDYHGNPFSIYGRQTLATNGKIHDECVEVLGKLA